MIWQLLASVFIPGFTINRTVELSNWFMMNLQKKRLISSPFMVRWIPVMIGIGTIPFIVHPIDHGTTKFLDCTLRRIYTIKNL